MFDIQYLLFLFVILTLIGCPLSRIIPEKYFHGRLLLSPTLGYGLSGVLIPIFYQAGFSVQTIYYLLVFSALVCLLMIMSVRTFRSSFLKEASDLRIYLLIGVLGLVVMLGPKLAGGSQFAVFQGNTADLFGYLNSAVVYSKTPYKEVLSPSVLELINQPLLSYASSNITLRPSVHLLYSVTGKLFPHNYMDLYYAFIVFFFFQSIFAIMFMISNLFRPRSRILTGMASLAFPLGFWGQYIFDINAWSQASSIPVLIAMVSFVVAVMSRSEIADLRGKDAAGVIAVIALLFSFAIYLYPENLVFHLACLFPAIAIYLVFFRNLKKKTLRVLIVMSGAIIGISAGFLFYKPTIGFVIEQLRSGISTNINYWMYFQAFLMGKDGINHSLLNNIIDFLSSFAGLYFITPAQGYHFVFSFFIRLIVFVFTLITSVLVWKVISNNNDSRVSGNKYLLIMLKASVFGVILAMLWAFNFVYLNGSPETEISIKAMAGSGSHSKIDVFLIGSSGEKIRLEKKQNGQWVSTSYFKNLEVILPKDGLERISSIEVKINDRAFSFNSGQVRSEWRQTDAPKGSAGLIIKPPEKLIVGLNPDLGRIKRCSGSLASWAYAFPISDVILIIIALLLVNVIMRNFKTETIDSEVRRGYAVFLMFMGAGAALMVYLLMKHNYWGAGKALSYLSPYLMVLIVSPAFILPKDKKNIWRYFILGFIVLQILFGIARIGYSKDVNGIHYKWPYPSILEPSLKENYYWDSKRIEDAVIGAKAAKIDIKNRWLENYCILYLYENDIRYYSANSINTYFGLGKDIGYQKPLKYIGATITDDSFRKEIKILGRP